MHPYHRPRRIQYALGPCLVAFGGLVRAQSAANIQQCDSLLIPSPCPLLESVMSTCANTDGESYTVPNINSQALDIYPAPAANATIVEQCQCTNVGYNLYAACAACQADNDIGHWLSRENWFAGCMANSAGSQIAVAPARMAPENITLWMTQIYNPTFSVGQALEVQSSDTPLPTTPATETASAESGNPSNTVKGSPGSGIISSGSTTNNTGIIVGAVVGAFALLAIVALGIIFCIRRRQRQERWLKRGPIIL